MDGLTDWYLNFVKATPTVGSRWSAAPTMFLWALLVIAADQVAGILTRTRRLTATAFALAGVCALSVSFTAPVSAIENTYMIPWSTGIAQARAVCQAGSTYATVYGAPMSASQAPESNEIWAWPCTMVLGGATH
jgi:hypothetical protein